MVLVARPDSEPMVLDVGAANDLLLPQSSMVLVRSHIAGVLSSVLLRVSPRRQSGQVWNAIFRDGLVRLQCSDSRVRATASAVVRFDAGADRNGVCTAACY